ncbi:MAG: M48 family metalloprotease [Pseudobacter sp.]|uniref:M48 family metalloprotease n=1 Tax=Pseudobacter sp. TaxID=2045420 RepID=UPI003F7EE96A
MYNHNQLSATHYKKQKDSIQSAWKCPTIFKQKEWRAQEKYKEIWDGRTKSFTKSFETNDYLYDEPIFSYVNGILNELHTANISYFKAAPFMLIDRSASVNAYAIGKNVFVLNLGLINFCETREELALAMAHELSHNILSHADNSIKSQAEMLTSDEYKDSLNAILKSKYERFSKLKKIMQTYSFDRRKHQRYHEEDADSLAIVLLKNANLAFDARFFQRLDSSDTEYHQPLKQEISQYFAKYELNIEDSWTQKRSRGLSTRNYNFKDSSVNRDSLKTHPDCEQRYLANRSKSDLGRKLTPIPASIKQRTNKFLIWYLFNNEALTACIYRIFQEKDKGNTDVWLDFMLYNAMSSLNLADRDMRRFAAIGIVQKEYVSTHYFALQTMMEQVPRQNLEIICRKLGAASFWNQVQPDEKAFRRFMAAIAIDPESEDKKKQRAAAADEFVTGFPNSAYKEFASPFEK